MKILHTAEFYSPSIGGAQEVVRQLSERMVKLGHTVTVATTAIPERKSRIIRGVRVKNFSIRGNWMKGLSGEVEKYRSFVVNGGFDVVMNYAAQQWTTDALLDILDTIPAKKVLVPCGFSGLYQTNYAEYFSRMPKWLKQYDATVYLSSTYRDVLFAKKHLVQNRVFIPNGAGEDEFLTPPNGDIRARLGIPSDHTIILTVGSHSGTKGHSEAIRLLKQISYPKVTLVVVANSHGGGCTDRCLSEDRRQRWNPLMLILGKKLVVRDLSRTDTLALFFAADLFLFLSNIECSPLVLFEAAAAGLPFLSADVGNAAEIALWTRGGKIIPTTTDSNGFGHTNPSEVVDMVEELLRNKKERERMGELGRRAWKQKFTWEKIVLDYEKLYKKLLAR